MSNIDLINGKEMFCPECGYKLEPQGKIIGNKAKVMAYCPTCRIDYSWTAHVNENNEHVISEFGQYKTSCNNSLCDNAKCCPYFQESKTQT